MKMMLGLAGAAYDELAQDTEDEQQDEDSALHVAKGLRGILGSTVGRGQLLETAGMSFERGWSISWMSVTFTDLSNLFELPVTQRQIAGNPSPTTAAPMRPGNSSI